MTLRREATGFFLRALASLVAVALVTGVGILRLERIPRPRASEVSRHAGGEVTQVRVTLRARTLGYGLRCGGREVLSRPGARPLAVFEASIGPRRYVVAGDGERALLLAVDGCARAIRDGTGALRAVRPDGDALRVEAATGAFRWKP